VLGFFATETYLLRLMFSLVLIYRPWCEWRRWIDDHTHVWRAYTRLARPAVLALLSLLARRASWHLKHNATFAMNKKLVVEVDNFIHESLRSRIRRHVPKDPFLIYYCVPICQLSLWSARVSSSCSVCGLHLMRPCSMDPRCNIRLPCHVFISEAMFDYGLISIAGLTNL